METRLTITNNYSIIQSSNKNLLKNIAGTLTEKDTKSAFGGGSFDVSKVKEIKFFKLKNDSIGFRTGLLLEAVRVIKKMKEPVKIDDQRKMLFYQKKEYSHDELRNYFNPDYKYVEHQIRALTALLKKNKGIIKATTSAGKSSIILALMKLSGLKCLVLVPKEDLGRQLAEDFRENGYEIGFNSGKTANKKIDTEISYVSTIGCAHKLPNDFDIVILDECHRGCSNVYQTYLASSKATAIYGFSATPEGNSNLDFMRVRQFLGDIIETIEAKELIDNGVIAYPNIKMISVNQIKTLDWPSANTMCIVENEERNGIIKDITNKYQEQTLILVRTIEHGNKLKEMIPDSIFVSGKDSSKVRKQSIEDFKNNKVRVMIASNIFNEGISINNIKVLIIASGGKSKIESVQKLGRVLRVDRKTGKVDGYVFDFADTGNKFTVKHSNARIKIYKEVGFPVEIIDSI